MARSRMKHDWRQTAGLCALIANCHRDKKAAPQPFKPRDFNPFEEAEPGEGGNVGFYELKAVLDDGDASEDDEG